MLYEALALGFTKSLFEAKTKALSNLSRLKGTKPELTDKLTKTGFDVFKHLIKHSNDSRNN